MGLGEVLSTLSPSKIIVALSVSLFNCCLVRKSCTKKSIQTRTEGEFSANEKELVVETVSELVIGHDTYQEEMRFGGQNLELVLCGPLWEVFFLESMGGSFLSRYARRIPRSTARIPTKI